MKFKSLTPFLCIGLAIISSNAYAALIVDQVGAPAVSGGYGGPVVQSFTPSQDNIAGVDAHFYSINGTTDATVSIWGPGSWTGNTFTGTSLHTETLTGISSCLHPNFLCHEFRWENTPVSITAGQLYFLEFTFGAGVLGAGATNPYLGGETLAGGGNLHNGNADLAFQTYYSSVVPIPAAVWLFGSGLLALVGLARRKQI